MKGTEYSVLLSMNVFLTEEYSVTVNSEELIGTTEYLSLYTRCCINRFRYNLVNYSFVYWDTFHFLPIKTTCLNGVHRK